jgi:hypothetical protein
MKQHGKELMARIPNMIVAEAAKIGAEMAQLVSEAAGEATREAMEDKRTNVLRSSEARIENNPEG